MTIAQDRIKLGQCPRCGQEAAPYYLCGKCRSKDALLRCLNKGARAGAFKKERRGRESMWSIGDDAKTFTFKEAKHDDKRLRPRIKGRGLDMEAILVGIITHIGRPCTEQEIVSAWGRLRAERTDPLATDLGRIILAQEKQDARNKKRATIAQRNAQSARG